MKKSEFKAQIREEIINILEATQDDVDTQQKFNDELKTTAQLMKDAGMVDEGDDYEGPTARQAKKGDSVSTLANKLGETKREMKQVVKDYKKAEGEEKLQYVKRLKELTSIKKELEQLLDNPKPAYQDDAF
jgi:hypothetical protein